MKATRRSPKRDVLTIEQIRARYPSEWVLLADPKTGRSQEVRRGRVLWHSKDRDELYRKALELRPKHSATLFTGRIAQSEPQG